MNTIWKYKPIADLVSADDRIFLGEGNTPLVASRFIGRELGIEKLFFKLENLNPTGSYKDRFAAVLVSGMQRDRQRACLATSSGNTGAALAAYSAAAGIRCQIVVVDGAPLPKLRQMQLYGAEIVMVRGFGKDPVVTQQVFNQLEEICNHLQIPLPISAYKYCERGMQGVETIAAEIVGALSDVGHIFVPAGGGGLTLAITRGVLQEGRDVRVHCVQPSGNNTIAGPLREGADKARSVLSSTAISGLQVANVIDGDHVIENCRRLGGNGYTVEDTSVYKWHKRMAQQEGIFCEPAGAVALAGLEDAIRKGEVRKDEPVVCLVTGSGFKDMPSVDRNFELPDVGLHEPDEAISIIKRSI